MTAVILGFVTAGALGLVGLRWPFSASHRGDWLTAAVIGAVTLAPLLLSILAIFKPRLAGYGFVAAFPIGFFFGFGILPPQVNSSPFQMCISPNRWSLPRTTPFELRWSSMEATAHSMTLIDLGPMIREILNGVPTLIKGMRAS